MKVNISVNKYSGRDLGKPPVAVCNGLARPGGWPQKPPRTGRGRLRTAFARRRKTRRWWRGRWRQHRGRFAVAIFGWLVASSLQQAARRSPRAGKKGDSPARRVVAPRSWAGCRAVPTRCRNRPCRRPRWVPLPAFAQEFFVKKG